MQHSAEFFGIALSRKKFFLPLQKLLNYFTRIEFLREFESIFNTMKQGTKAEGLTKK
jgi:hypothetical protein